MAVAPAALPLRPCAGLARSSSRLPPSPLPPAGGLETAKRRRLRLAPPTGISPRLVGGSRAVAVDSDQLGSPEPAQQEKPKRYYFLVANAKFMLDEEEHFKELLSERLCNYRERDKEQDFWLVVEPKFLDKFPGITRRLKRPAAALVSTDGTWITFMKLRLDRVLADHFDANTLDEALASNPVDLQFEKPEKWTAPYPKYEFGWWEPYLPPASGTGKA